MWNGGRRIRSGQMIFDVGAGSLKPPTLFVQRMPPKRAFVNREEGTHYGRVLRNLGHMNLLVYCNDGRQRICHIRGAMRKRGWVNVGDIVLVSYRDFEVGMYKEVGEEKGDILHKYDASDHSRLRGDRLFNPALLLRLEAQSDLNNIVVHSAAVAAAMDGAGVGAGANTYLFQSEKEAADEGVVLDAEGEPYNKPKYKGEKSRTEEARRAAGLQAKGAGAGAGAGAGDDDEIDIDAI